MDNLNPKNLANFDKIETVDLQVEMARSYLDYAMSVIVGRALPDVRDGLKPVHRRVLYAMYDAGYRPDKGYYKSSRIVGDVMGNYHPHGDTAIYDSVVRLAQHWSLRYLLIDGNGNFGSPGNDPAAAMRYTEARLSPIAMEMMRDIDEDTVNFVPNYDGRSQEPTVLPSRFPNLLVNGSAGIAVGMATNIPPHNLREIGEAVVYTLDHPELKQETLLNELLKIVKGPDFPTKALSRLSWDQGETLWVLLKAIDKVSQEWGGRLDREFHTRPPILPVLRGLRLLWIASWCASGRPPKSRRVSRASTQVPWRRFRTWRISGRRRSGHNHRRA